MKRRILKSLAIAVAAGIGSTGVHADASITMVEDPADAVRREVAEETGLSVTKVETGGRRSEVTDGWPYVVTGPVAIVSGVAGAYPSIHAVYACYAAGEPRPVDGETADPRWWLIEDVRDLLRTDPEAFVGQTYAVLSAVLGV